MIKTGNLFKLAEKQLIRENKDYTITDVIDYAILIRKELDRLEAKGKVKNIHTKKLETLYTPQELRRIKYIKTGK